jgi:hypothetical protein
MTGYDTGKVDEVILGLLYLTLHNHNRAWKGFDWDATDRLFEAGWIEDPRNKNKSIVLTEAGLKKSKELFEKHFGKNE